MPTFHDPEFRFVAEKNPCPTCPYLLNAPSGLWHPDEYAKLVQYDAPISEQPTGVFLCHNTEKNFDRTTADTLCKGWVAVHGWDLLALRLCASMNKIDTETVDEPVTVKLHKSGTAAAEHGLRDVDTPGAKAQRAIDKLTAERARRGPNRNWEGRTSTTPNLKGSDL